jgi:hypothetical protein
MKPRHEAQTQHNLAFTMVRQLSLLEVLVHLSIFAKHCRRSLRVSKLCSRRTREFMISYCIPAQDVLQRLTRDTSLEQLVCSGAVGFPCHPEKKAMAKNSSGAVCRGLEGNQVDNRMTRCHYGIKCTETYSPEGQKSGRKPVWCELEQVWNFHDGMNWFINKVSRSGCLNWGGKIIPNPLKKGTFNCREKAVKTELLPSYFRSR